jgi:hypothetical protein
MALLPSGFRTLYSRPYLHERVIMFARLGLALLLAIPTTVMAADNSLPIVSEVTENTAGTQITIIGNGFGT